MTDAWKTSLQTSQKIVLLALCDNANDQGECYPSISTIASKCSMSERNVFYVIAQLDELKLVSKFTRKGRSTLYTIHPCNFFTGATNSALQRVQDTPAVAAQAPMQVLQEASAVVAPITVKESSNESLINLPAKKVTKQGQVEKPEDVDQDVWNDFLVIRKTKKSPLTQTALKMLRIEVQKANKTLNEALMVCCQRGWQTYKSQWDRDLQADSKAKELPLATNEQIEHAYRVECGKDPAKARFNSYYEMRKYITDYREANKGSS